MEEKAGWRDGSSRLRPGAVGDGCTVFGRRSGLQRERQPGGRFATAGVKLHVRPFSGNNRLRTRDD